MNFELRKDEQLYASPARLLGEYSLYKDIFYNHTPGSAWLFHGIMRILGTDHLLFAARLGVFAGWVVFGLSLLFISYKLTQSSVMTCLTIIFIMANEALLNQTGMAATNNFLPLALAYVGLGLFLLGTADGEIKSLLIGASGFALSMAAVVKINAFVFIPVVAIASFLLPHEVPLLNRMKWVVVPLAVGGIVGALPVLFYLAIDPVRFLAHVYGYHVGPHIAYWAAQSGSDEQVAIGTGAKAQLGYSIWFSGANLLFVFCGVYLSTCLMSIDTLRAFACRILNGRMLLVLASLLISIGMSFVPTPAFPQYFTLPLACAPLLLSILYAELDPTQKGIVQRGLGAACVAMLLSALPQLMEYAPRLAFPRYWTVERIHGDGLKITKLLADAGVSGKVATLAPIYPLEGGLSVYPELASGPFAYRIAEFTDPSLLKYYHTTSPRKIGAFLQADPPVAILVGFDAILEAPLVKFANDNAYRRIENLGISDRYGEGVLYIRTSSNSSN